MSSNGSPSSSSLLRRKHGITHISTASINTMQNTYQKDRTTTLSISDKLNGILRRRGVVCLFLAALTISILILSYFRSYSLSLACNKEAKGDGDTTSSNDNNNSTTLLQSYTYSNCPFTMAKFSLHEIALRAREEKDDDKDDSQQQQLLDIAKQSLDLSNNAKAYQRILNALQSGAFNNRKIILDGDSLTRQLFISLSCIAWSAGYVSDYTINNYDVWEGSTNNVLHNINYTASEQFNKQVHVKLKGGGDIYYIDYFNHAASKKINHAKMIQHMINSACGSSGLLQLRQRHRYYKARYSLDDNDSLLTLNKDDVVILSAGHHEKLRPMYLAAYKEFFQCIQDDSLKPNGKKRLSNWPHFFYQLSTVSSFNTIDGEYTSEPIVGKDRMSCQSTNGSSKLQQEDRDNFNGSVQFIANSLDLSQMGDYHVGHGSGDCVHWIQPGGKLLSSIIFVRMTWPYRSQ